jgi:hypothetical protein
MAGCASVHHKAAEWFSHLRPRNIQKLIIVSIHGLTKFSERSKQFPHDRRQQRRTIP